MFTRFAPALGIGLYVAVCIVWRSWLQRRRHGGSGIAVFQQKTPVAMLQDIIFTAMFLAIIAQPVVFALAPTMLAGSFLQPPTVHGAELGLALVLAGLALTVAAQLGMGVSWRVGIDYESSPGLVTGGLYQFCRNPIYLGMAACLIGMTIMLPTYLSLALTAVTFAIVRAQTLAEERYLEQTYGEPFRQYAAQVGRYLPGLGKLQ
jgi:protein-S-isoprenylcysteine O-methyltransferase Ste14